MTFILFTSSTTLINPLLVLFAETIALLQIQQAALLTQKQLTAQSPTPVQPFSSVDRRYNLHDQASYEEQRLAHTRYAQSWRQSGSLHSSKANTPNSKLGGSASNSPARTSSMNLNSRSSLTIPTTGERHCYSLALIVVFNGVVFST
jgi:hypothetical protein